MTSPRCCAWCQDNAAAVAAEIEEMERRLRNCPSPAEPLARRAVRALGLAAEDALVTILALAVLASGCLLELPWMLSRALGALRRRAERWRQ